MISHWEFTQSSNVVWFDSRKTYSYSLRAQYLSGVCFFRRFYYYLLVVIVLFASNCYYYYYYYYYYYQYHYYCCFCKHHCYFRIRKYSRTSRNLTTQTWVDFCWVCAAGLSEPQPNYSLFCAQL